MRKLLSLLTVLTLTVPVPLNVIACGGTKTPPVTDDTDYLTLSQEAKEKIQTEFANLVNNESNLRVEGDVTNGAAIMTYLNTTDQTQDTNITNKETIDGFLEVLKNQVGEISNKLVSNYPILKPLFNGINPNDILKVNTNDLDTTLTSKAFDWKHNDFGLKDFDAEDDPYNVTDWYYISANLKLDFTCLDENGKSTTRTINQTYDMYFANNGSNLINVVNVVTANIKEKLEKIKLVNLEYESWKDSFVNQKLTVLHDINNQLTNNSQLTGIKGLKIDTQEIDNPYNNDYHWMESRGYDFGIQGAQKIKSEEDFYNKWNPKVTTRENNFITRLNTWKDKYNLTIDNQDNVFVFGEYKTTNWKISGLEIKTISVPYYIATKDISRLSNTNNSLEILEKLFVGDDALFKWGKNWTMNKEDHNFNFALNPTVYDDFKNKNVLIQEIYEYVTKQTNDFGKSKGFINEQTDKVQWTTGGNTDWLNKKFNEVVIPADNQHKNWILVINGLPFAMSLQENKYQDVRFSITRSETDVWPEIK